MFDYNPINGSEPLGIYISNPANELLFCINDYIDTESASLKVGLNQQFELDITVNKTADDEYWYEYLQEGMYLFVEKIGFFKMSQPQVDIDGVKETKNISARSCDCELEDKECQVSINTGVETSQEYLVAYDEGETELLINPYTGITYDRILMYNTFPEQLKQVLSNYHAGHYGTTDVNGNMEISDPEKISKLKPVIDTIPRLKSKVIAKNNGDGNTQYEITDYVYYEENDEGNISKIVLTREFKDRITSLISFYEKYRNQLSLISIILDKTGGNWTVGNIYGVDKGDYSLANRVDSFDIDTNIYAFFTQTWAQASKCIFQFDIFNRKVNVTPVDKIGEDTGIVLSYDNLVNQLGISADEDSLCTRLYVEGADDLGIEQVNFGLPYIDDIDYKLNVRNSKGQRIYVSDDLADKYKAYKEKVESQRSLYIEESKKYNRYAKQISEIKYRVPNDGLKTDWSTFSKVELDNSLTSYTNLLSSLIAMYRADYGDSGFDSRGNINEAFIKDTIYWWDYSAYISIIKQIECAIAVFPYYSDKSKWTADNLQKYKDAVTAWETNWSLYGAIELQAKIDAYTQNMNLLAGKSVVRKSENSDEIYTWDELPDKDKFGNDQNNYGYDIYMEYFNKRKEAKIYLDELNSQIAGLEALQKDAQQKRVNIVKEVSWENNFDKDEVKVLNLLIKESTYSNENILTTSIDSSDTVIDTMAELLKDGQETLSTLSRPQLIFTTDADNVFALPEYSALWNDFKCGNYITVQYKDDTYIKLRLIGYTFNPCLPSSDDLDLTFSNFIRSKSKVSDLESILGLSNGSVGGSRGSSGSSGSGTYGESKDIDIIISNTMLSKLLSSESFGSRVKDVVINSLNLQSLTAQYATISDLNTTTIEADRVKSGLLTSDNYNGNTEGKGILDNTAGSVINLNDGTFNFAGGALKWNGDQLNVKGHVEADSGSISIFDIKDTGLFATFKNSDDEDSYCLTKDFFYVGLGGYYSLADRKMYPPDASVKVETNPEQYGNGTITLSANNRINFEIDSGGESERGLFVSDITTKKEILSMDGDWLHHCGTIDCSSLTCNTITCNDPAATRENLGITRENLGITNKILWNGNDTSTGGVFMQKGQVATLNDAVLNQPNGIVLIFSAYGQNDETQKYEALDFQFQSFFIPKKFVELHPGCGQQFALLGGISTVSKEDKTVTGCFTRISYKYLYIHNDHIEGHAANNFPETTTPATTNGITYHNRYYVLRYVIGV